MLEERIEKLTEAINRLCDMFSETVVSLEMTPPPTKTEKPKKEKEKNVEETKAEEPEKTEPEAAEVPEEEITEQSLIDICLKVVRNDPSKQKQIKAAISKHGGDLIKNVPKDQWPELKKELEAI